MQLNFERKKSLKEFLRNIHISFKDYNLLNLSLSHRSYVNEHNLPDNNEKLEFLGDSILGFVITEFLFKSFPDHSEGSLARIKSFVISENTLSKVAKRINLNKYILIGKGEESSGGRSKKTIISDAFEAFLGAYYLDSNLNKIKNLIINLFKNEIELVIKDKHEKDYKTLLQEFSQKKYKVCPVYNLKSTKGPEHDRTFYVNVSINKSTFGVGEGKSIKDAEKVAAKRAYNKINSPILRSNPKKKIKNKQYKKNINLNGN